MADSARSDGGQDFGAWNWHPALPLEGAPILIMPPRPLAALSWLFSYGFLWSLMVPYVGTALVAWYLLQPPLAQCTELVAPWVLAVWGRNLALMLAVAGGLHLHLHRHRRQGLQGRFEKRELGRDDPRFLGRSQVVDNMVWSLASGVTLWSVFEVLLLWGYANGALPYLTWSDSPVWFVLLFVAIPFWQSLHFYVIHRLLHWKPLYRAAHGLHHRNVAIGPWSGISMHPVEHVLYFSSVLIHLVVPSHPLHMIFHMHFLVLPAVMAHSGYQDLSIGGRRVLGLGDFFHQLHHRHFTCNYGTDYIPLDRWLGSLHDGTPEATRRLARQGRIKAS